MLMVWTNHFYRKLTLRLMKYLASESFWPIIIIYVQFLFPIFLEFIGMTLKSLGWHWFLQFTHKRDVRVICSLLCMFISCLFYTFVVGKSIASFVHQKLVCISHHRFCGKKKNNNTGGNPCSHEFTRSGRDRQQTNELIMIVMCDQGN